MPLMASVQDSKAVKQILPGSSCANWKILPQRNSDTIGASSASSPNCDLSMANS